MAFFAALAALAMAVSCGSSNASPPAPADAGGGTCTANLSGAVSANFACTVFIVFRPEGAAELQINNVQDAGTELQAQLKPMGFFAVRTYEVRDLDPSSLVELDGTEAYMAIGGVPLSRTSIELVIASLDANPSGGTDSRGMSAIHTHGTLKATLAAKANDAGTSKTANVTIEF